MHFKFPIIFVLIVATTFISNNAAKLKLGPPVKIENVIGIGEILDYGYNLAMEKFKSWDETKSETADRTLLEKSEESELMIQIGEVSSQINRLDVKVQSHMQRAISVLIRELPSRFRLELRLDALADMMTKVNVASLQLERYMEYNAGIELGAWRLERHTIEEFAVWAVSPQTDSVANLMERIHQMIAPSETGLLGRGVLERLRDTINLGSNLCDLNQSPQQLLYNIFASAVLTELKGYATVQFSWMLLRHYNKGNFTLEKQMMHERYLERTVQKIKAVKSATVSAKRDLYLCDPRTHVEGETYVQLTRLLQGYIQNEVDVTPHSSCWQNCAYYTDTKSYDCYMDQYCAEQQPCNGTLHDCKFFDSDMWICRDADNPVRRYEWIKYEDGQALGQVGECRSGTTKVDSWWRWLFWHCSYCLCVCDEEGPLSDRFFGLKAVTSDVNSNRVVTGLRIVKQDRVVQLQIQEGTVLPRGGVNASTLSWRPVEDYETTNAYNKSDYHTMDWGQRAINLDDLVAPPGHVLTGVRFRTVGTHLGLDIMTTPLNFTAGSLITPQTSSVWITSSDEARKHLDVPSPDVPTRSLAPSVPDSTPGQFVLFGQSSAEADVSQTTVPFLDAQPVTLDPPTLLAGAGLYHKGQPGYGGFVAPKLVTYDYSQHVDVDYFSGGLKDKP